MHTDQTHCYRAHMLGACHRTHVPGVGVDSPWRDGRPASEPGSIVMQGHADYCSQYGHVEGGGYGNPDLCARCGDPHNREEATQTARLRRA